MIKMQLTRVLHRSRCIETTSPYDVNLFYHDSLRECRTETLKVAEVILVYICSCILTRINNGRGYIELVRVCLIGQEE